VRTVGPTHRTRVLNTYASMVQFKRETKLRNAHAAM